MSVEELQAEILRLSPEALAYLARELLASLDAMTEAEIEELWLQEAIRRDEELDSGTARSYPADDRELPRSIRQLATCDCDFVDNKICLH